jgi:hypothetical protein
MIIQNCHPKAWKGWKAWKSILKITVSNPPLTSSP